MSDGPTPGPAPKRLTRQQQIAAIVAASAGVPLACVMLTFAILWLRCGGRGCPDVGLLRAYQPGKASRLLDRKGRVFAELRPVDGATVPLPQVPEQARAAFLAVE